MGERTDAARDEGYRSDRCTTGVLTHTTSKPRPGNFLEAWSEIEAPVLVIYGEYDQFETRHGHELIATTVNRLRPGTARFVFIDRMDHDYGVYATAEDAYSWTYGPSAPGHDARELVIGEILRWLGYSAAVDTIRAD